MPCSRKTSGPSPSSMYATRSPSSVSTYFGSQGKPGRFSKRSSGVRKTDSLIVGLEELILAGEDFADGVVAEDAADRIGEDVGHRDDLDLLRRAGAQRDRVGDDDLLERRVLEILERAAGEHRVCRRGDHALGAFVVDGLGGGAERA